MSLEELDHAVLRPRHDTEQCLITISCHITVSYTLSATRSLQFMWEMKLIGEKVREKDQIVDQPEGSRVTVWRVPWGLGQCSPRHISALQQTAGQRAAMPGSLHRTSVLGDQSGNRAREEMNSWNRTNFSSADKLVWVQIWLSPPHWVALG